MQQGVADPQQAPMGTQAIWDQFHGRLLAFVRRRVSNAADAEDILQDVFSRIHTNLHKLHEAQSVAAWVYRITTNAITDHYRAKAKVAGALGKLRRETGSPGDLSLPLREGPGEDPDLSTELSHCLVPFLTRLPDSYQEAIRLTDLGDLSQKQAAQRLGLSVSGLKSRVQRGRSKLKDILLECCAVELDRRRGVVDVQPRDSGGCDDCGCS
jgi:RNA polymerase sigma-70 factor (ECF subfamily)